MPLSIPNALPKAGAGNITYRQEQHPAAPHTTEGILCFWDKQTIPTKTPHLLQTITALIKRAFSAPLTAGFINTGAAGLAQGLNPKHVLLRPRLSMHCAHLAASHPFQTFLLSTGTRVI